MGINETGHMRSQMRWNNLLGLTTRSDVNKLLQGMLDAETGQRGYLLTATCTYLEPYDKAVISAAKPHGHLVCSLWTPGTC